MEKNKENPDKYISRDSSIYWGYLNGKQYVDGCSCNSASSYETFLWNHRWLIEEYFSAKAEKMRERAEEQTSLAGKVSESVNPKN